MNTENTPEMSEADQLFTMVLARLEVLESVVMLLWNNHPNREAVKAAAELIAESRAATDLNESTSELSVRIRADARHDALAAIFHELPPMSDDAQTHTAQ